MSDLSVQIPSEAIAVDEESPVCSPNDRLSTSFCSVATSLGPETFSPVPHAYCVKASDVFLENEEEEEDNDESTIGTEKEDEEALLDEVTQEIEAEARRRYFLVHGPSRANLEADAHRLQAMRQNRLNDFILQHTKATQASRQDHHIMLRQLIGEAFRRDPKRREHRPQWKRIIAAVRKEYWGANAIFTLSPDPYHNVLAKLSSMMLWDDEVRHWAYTYNESELTRRRERQVEVLTQLQESGKLFL